MINNKNEKIKEKALTKLMGRNLLSEVLFTMCIVLIVGLTITIGYVWGREGFTDKTEFVVMMLLITILILEAIWLSILLIKHYTSINKQKEKFNALSNQRKEKLINLATQYRKKDGIGFEEDYLFGIMNKRMGIKGKLRSILSFKYLEYSQLQWVYPILNSVQMNSQYTTTPVIFRDSRQDKLRIYDIEGNCYEALIRETNCDMLFAMISEKNKNCKIGLSQEKQVNKEWVEKYSTKIPK